MEMDTILLKFEAMFDKATASVGNAIKVFKNLDSATSGVANNFDKMASNVETSMNRVAKSIDSSGAKKKLEDLKKQLNFEIGDYNKNLGLYKQWGSLATTKSPESTIGMGGQELLKQFGEPITPETLNEQKARIESLRQEIQILKTDIESTPKLKVIPKTGEESKNMREVGDEVDRTTRKVDKLSSSGRRASSSFLGIERTMKNVGKSFNKFTNNFTKSVEGNVKHLKKLALGLIGVRTAMSLLTKGVNAYLSFDSELQESISNSWNMLGALLAPAIELVANLFAMATNYIAQFISTLTGIDLVARANAKALDTQAKAAKGASAAQRGLLSMDEITNLPTEPGGAGGGLAKQINAIDTKPIKLLNDFLTHLKSKEWHLAGEDIAHAINRGLKALDWDNIKPKAHNLGKNIASFLNGVFELNWYDLGRTFGEGINTMIEFAEGFIDEFSVIQLLGGIAKAINKTMETIDWNKAAETFGKGIVKTLNGITTFLDQVNWEQIGEKITGFLADVDWFGIAIANTKLQLALLKAVVGLAKGVIKELPGWIQGNLEVAMAQMGSAGGKAIANGFIAGINGLINAINAMVSPMQSIINSIASIAGKRAPSIFFMRNIPYLETGTNEIEYEGLYHLHEGEAVVPKKYNPTTGGYDNSADNRQIIDLLVSLNSNMVTYANRPIEVNMDGKKVAEGTYEPLQQIDRNRNTSNVVVRS